VTLNFNFFFHLESIDCSNMLLSLRLRTKHENYDIGTAVQTSDFNNSSNRDPSSLFAVLRNLIIS
jgi:hypothetical protein